MGNGNIKIVWDSTAGTTYMVDQAQLGEGGSFENIAVVEADDETSEFMITDTGSSSLNCYRVCVVQ